jgi:DEAD/DEAH box helicase domain-containing protein
VPSRTDRDRKQYQTTPTHPVPTPERRELAAPPPARQPGVGTRCQTREVSTAAPGPGTAGDALLERLTTAPGREDRLRHVERLPPRAADPVPWPSWVDAGLRDAWATRGVLEPWRHQVEAAEAARRGEHVVLATGTASGKSLAYQLPALATVREARGARGQRGAAVLYVAPTKALAHDQEAALRGLGTDVRLATHDGDTPPEARAWTRDHGEYVLTNPDMLHHSLLPGHEGWTRFWGALRYVVLDECHHYRGVFGAHVAQVVRRLRRVAARYGADPTFVLASATVAEPGTAATRLTGLPVTAITDDGSPRGRVSLGLWEPPFTSFTGENGAPVRRGAPAESADLLTDLVVEGVRTLVFVRSRRGVEQVAGTATEQLAEVAPELAGRVAAYRGGYLPEERRELEGRLRSGDLVGLAATNALELGIDVSGLDAVVMAGFPGTRAALWQQLGRAGRGGRDALGLLVARDDPLDTYLVTHPEALVGRPVEASVFDPGNPHVLGPHLCAAAQEAPLTEEDLALFGDTARDAVEALTDAGLLRRRHRGWYWTHDQRAAALADLRSSEGSTVQVVEEGTGRVVGLVDGARAHGTVHTGAVYVHQGESWLVHRLDLDEHVATVARTSVDWTTSARELSEIGIRRETEHEAWGDCRLSLGTVDVRQRTVSYLRRRRRTGEVLAEEPLDLPERTLTTQAVWWTVPDHVLEDSPLEPADLPGAAHAAEHCSIGLLPLVATCDRWDIGGVSTARHPDTGLLTVFVHDGHPGGAGFAERGFRSAHGWLSATREAIAACECADGCPSCVQSPKCGNQNHPLDKTGAVTLLDLLLTGAG